MAHTRRAALIVAISISAPVVLGQPRAPEYHTHNDRYPAPVFSSLAEWQRRASYLREHVLASAGLLPLPVKAPLNAHVFDERRHDDYSVFKVYFESLPGFYVTGNLYRPSGDGPFPAVLSPHGHWTYGRFENTPIASLPGRAINLARQGFVVFSWDLIGYNDSRQLTHDFGGRRESLWGLSLAGLQLWNSIRSLDFLESLPFVDASRMGSTGASGGGTQTFLLAAVDDRVKVAAPVNMISLHMQGGCLCENPPGLRLDTNNVELAATIAPRPLLMVAATGDWTNETLQLEYPAARSIYSLFDAANRVHAVQFDAPHNDNQESREAVYSWMARWLKNAPEDSRVAERPFRPDPLSDVLVFYGRSLPDGALTATALTDRWIESARAQLRDANRQQLQAALLHALGLAKRLATGPVRRSRAVVLASESRDLAAKLGKIGFAIRPVRATPFDANAPSRIPHFETYNRTAASQRVADIVRVLDENPGALLVADGASGPPALLAIAAARVPRAVVDIGRFDNSSDQSYLDRLYIPGIRRAGDFQTALSVSQATVVIHNAGDHFKLDGPRIEARTLSSEEIAAIIK